MKKTISTIFSILLAGAALAQPAITNGTFEAWTGVGGGLTWHRPEGWHGSDKLLNDVAPMLGFAGVTYTAAEQMTQSEDAYEGSYAARLMSVDLGGTLGPTPALMVNGSITLNMAAAMEAIGGGEVELTDLFNVAGGTPLLGLRADSVEAYVKTPESNVDTGRIIVQAQKIDGDSMVTIGAGYVDLFPGMDYERVAVNIEYFNPEDRIADTLIIIVISSATLPTETSFFGASDGNTVIIDAMKLYATDVEGITDRFVDLGVQAYPNPAQGIIQFENNAAQSFLIQIYDLSGKIMHLKELPQGVTQIDLQQYPAGNYIYRIADAQSGKLQSGTFTKM